MPTVINVYDTVASIGVNDPEASLTIYEMFIGVGPTGPAVVTDVCMVGRSAVQTIPDGSVATTYLSFDEEISDTTDLHESITNPTYITVAKTGIYLIAASRIKFTAHATGLDYCYIVANASTLLAEEIKEANSSIDNQFNLNIIANLTAGDYVRIGVKQTSGGDLDVMRVANLSPLFSVCLLKDLT